MLEISMPIDNSDLNDLLRKATKPYKKEPTPPLHVLWWRGFVRNLKFLGKITIGLLIAYSIGVFAYEHPVYFMMMLAALG